GPVVRTTARPAGLTGDDDDYKHRKEQSMIEANRPPAPLTAAEPASPSATAGSDDRSTGSVNLGRRFFNVKTGLSFLLGIVILVTLLRVTNVDFSEVLAQLGQMNPRVYALAILCYVLTFPF